MSTWWTPARRTDIGLNDGDLPATTFTVTNRAWYVLHTALTTLSARSTATLSQPTPFVPTVLAQHWGALITTSLGGLVQLGRYDGRAVTYAGLALAKGATTYTDTHEVTALPATPIGAWLDHIGQQLATTPTGYAISGRPPHQGVAMTVSLSKGGNVNLSKEAPGLTAVTVGLGWDARTTTGAQFDLDASAIILGANGRVLSDKHFVFFNQLADPSGAVKHLGDNLTGTGSGDDEQITVNLAGLPADAQRVVFSVSIYEAKERGQSFGQVRNAFIRVVNQAGGTEITRYDLTEDASTETAMVFGELYRHGADWKFRAVGQGYANGLAGIASDFGVNV